MKSFLSFLSEGKIAKGKTSVVVTFGRFNPLSSGHEKLAMKLKKEADKRKALPIMFTSGSQDPKKNPLQFKDKVKLMKKAFPYLEVSTDASLKTLFQIAGQLSDEGVKEFTLVVGSDRVQEFKKSLGKYVGATTGSLQLNFDKFEVVSAGQRDESGPNLKAMDVDQLKDYIKKNGVSGMSASLLRKLVETDEEELFIQGLPSKLVKDGKKIFKLVKKGMRL